MWPDDATEGTTFQNVLSNFPCRPNSPPPNGSGIHLTSPNGEAQSFTREVKDLIGAAARLTGGSITLSPPPNNAALLDTSDLFSTWILPNTVPDWVINRQVGPSPTNRRQPPPRTPRPSARSHLDNFDPGRGSGRFATTSSPCKLSRPSC
ncbi:MAG: hypothetical protein IPL78_06390 [Chloroflexi bacterium]|nr:hypothetical protein [Chloroflexota bacterium]